MSKGILLFDLPQDADEFWVASNAADISAALSDYGETLRRIVKYDTDEHSEEVIEAYDHARRLFIEELSERGLLRVLDL